MLNRDTFLVKGIEKPGFIEHGVREAIVIATGMDIDHEPCRLMEAGDTVLISHRASGEDVEINGNIFTVLRKNFMLLNKTRFFKQLK